MFDNFLVSLPYMRNSYIRAGYSYAKQNKINEAIACYELIKGDGKVYFNLAKLYERKKDIKKSKNYYLLAIEAGYKQLSYFALAQLYETQNDIGRAIYYYCLSGQSGNKNAYLKSGELYEKNGNIVKAIQYYEYIHDNSRLSKAYFKKGQLHEKNLQAREAIYAYYKSAKNNKNTEAIAALERFSTDENPNVLLDAKYYLGMICEHQGNWSDALGWYEAGVEENDARSMYQLGKLYETGHGHAIEKNSCQSAYYYRQAATFYSAEALDILLKTSQTNPYACLHLAEMYRKGEGVGKQNPEEATKLLKHALQLLINACDKDSEADFLLGKLYDPAITVNAHPEINKDPKQSTMYYLKAARQKHDKALQKLETRYDESKEAQLA
jgi:TPR repeat protein